MWHPFESTIRLYGRTEDEKTKRIEKPDAARQERTAREILRRLSDQPGLVLADEVGMGKTFVALAVATSVALSDARRRPVVVMVPPSLKEKWPQDFSVFKDRCLPPEIARRVRAASADSAVGFLKLLDDPIERRASIVFLTHGAMHRGLSDGWVKLAMIQRVLHRRHNTGRLRLALGRCAGSLLRLGWVQSRSEDIWERLLDAPTARWLNILRLHGIDPEGDGNPETDDDPVPRAVVKALKDFDTADVYAVLQEIIPRRQSATFDERVADARRLLTEKLKEVWRQCLTSLEFKLPLLVMDEAHHLKNPAARLSGLFQNPDAKDDAEEIARGSLGGIFERMLFLTATPFQLGHHELCSILERFEGIAWNKESAPPGGRDVFRTKVSVLRQSLDAAQRSAVLFDEAWGRLRAEDLVVNGRTYASAEVESWWNAVQISAARTPVVEQVLSRNKMTDERMRVAEKALQPWVIRHLRDRVFNGKQRRERLPGKAILDNTPDAGETGIEIAGGALLPFLLAARATACAPNSRPVFAEGLASSYETFLHTRKANEDLTDGDDDEVACGEPGDAVGKWYLDRLEEALPLKDHSDSAAHPKIAATAKCVMDAWGRGEKVVVFCHYIQTGRVLRQVISGMMMDQIIQLGAAKLGCKSSEVMGELDRLGRAFDEKRPARRLCDDKLTVLLQEHPALAAQPEALLEIARRYLRTPSFLARFFQLDAEAGINEAAVEKAFATGDMADWFRDFFAFLANRCVEEERKRYLEAIATIQTGTITGLDVASTFSEDERQGAAPERLLPNVRLVNGAVKSETRQRLMLTFNSPFFPEVLIASSVMAEGVDLHRFCCYVIHHDLCWNPSTLEQRTGRVDRIGAKVERCGQPIRVYLPYLAETQDEKQYRVVMDRERWFGVVMGEKFRVDARTTDKLAQRVPLPASVAKELAFRLEVEL
jgi:superfamily II DNA or RNA helicase